MEAKHTPGPWEINASDVCLIRIAVSRGLGLELPVAEVLFNPSVETPGEHSANARLIAAAPDLLEALEYIDAVIGEQGGPIEPGELIELVITGQTLIGIRAAIAKATGGTA